MSAILFVRGLNFRYMYPTFSYNFSHLQLSNMLLLYILTLHLTFQFGMHSIFVKFYFFGYIDPLCINASKVNWTENCQNCIENHKSWTVVVLFRNLLPTSVTWHYNWYDKCSRYVFLLNLIIRKLVNWFIQLLSNFWNILFKIVLFLSTLENLWNNKINFVPV